MADDSTVEDNNHEDRVLVVTESGTKFTVLIAVAKLSNTLNGLLKDVKLQYDDKGKPKTEIPCGQGNDNIITIVLKYCNHYKDANIADLNKRMELGQFEDFELALINNEFKDQAVLFETILVANYLDITSLLNMCCVVVANMIKGKSSEEIRKTFNIKDDFTPEQKELIRKENDFLTKK